jgi:hypothetical protein
MGAKERKGSLLALPPLTPFRDRVSGLSKNSRQNYIYYIDGSLFSFVWMLFVVEPIYMTLPTFALGLLFWATCVALFKSLAVNVQFFFFFVSEEYSGIPYLVKRL